MSLKQNDEYYENMREVEEEGTVSKSQLDSFTEYCKNHPTERFWQALRNWAGVPCVFVGDKEFDLDTKDYVITQWRDTFYD